MYDAETIVIVGTAASTLFAFLMFLYKKLVKPTMKFMEDYEDTKQSIKIIKAEVTPNGGSSIKDTINNLKHTCSSIERYQKVLDQRSKASLHYHKYALFEIDSHGRMIWFNEKLKSFLLHKGFGNVQGFDWISIIDEEYREEFVKEFTSCVAMCRKIDVQTTSANGGKIHFVGYPYRVSEEDHEGFLIHLYEEEN